jgi:hypothetical protein
VDPVVSRFARDHRLPSESPPAMRTRHPGRAIASATPGSADDNILDVGVGDVIEFAGEGTADGGLLLVCPGTPTY